VANNSWCRRTTEVVDVSHAQAVDTDVIVDVDLAYADHEAFELDAGITWLPLLALPPMRSLEHEALTGWWSAVRPGCAAGGGRPATTTTPIRSPASR